MRVANVSIWHGTDRVGFCDDFTELKIVDAHNQISVIKVTLPYGHRAFPLMVHPKARIHVDAEDLHWTGKVRSWAGEAYGPMSFTASDDIRLLWRLLAWPVPGAGLTGQTVEYARKTGPAETVFKDFLRDNLGRLAGVPVVVKPDQRRGNTISVDMRFHPLAERLLPEVDKAHLGVSCRMVKGVIEVDCYQTWNREDWPLSFDAGTLQSLEFEGEHPSATRVVAGGQGEGVERAFQQQIDTARETEYADSIEKFVDARDCDTAEKLTARVASAMADTEPRSGLKLTMSETDHYRYQPDRFYKGDWLTIRYGGQTFSDRLRSVELTWSKVGHTAVPQIGDRTDDPNAELFRKIRELEMRISDLGKS